MDVIDRNEKENVFEKRKLRFRTNSGLECNRTWILNRSREVAIIPKSWPSILQSGVCVLILSGINRVLITTMMTKSKNAIVSSIDFLEFLFGSYRVYISSLYVFCRIVLRRFYEVLGELCVYTPYFNVIKISTIRLVDKFTALFINQLMVCFFFCVCVNIIVHIIFGGRHYFQYN